MEAYKKLQDILKEEDHNTLRYEVATRINQQCEDGDELASFLRDLSMHGCVSGMCNSLIYYSDTHAFYDAWYEEIEELRNELEDGIGDAIEVKGDLKNFYAWLAFEETARKIAEEIGLGDY